MGWEFVMTTSKKLGNLKMRYFWLVLSNSKWHCFDYSMNKCHSQKCLVGLQMIRFMVLTVEISSSKIASGIFEEDPEDGNEANVFQDFNQTLIMSILMPKIYRQSKWCKILPARGESFLFLHLVELWPVLPPVKWTKYVWLVFFTH